MLQREIGNAKVTPPDALPARGDRVREFSLSTLSGSQVALSGFRGNRNLILVLLGSPQDHTTWLEQLLQRQGEIEARNTSLLLVLRGESEEGRTLSRLTNKSHYVLCDPDGALHRAMGACVAGQLSPAAYVTDRFGEIVALWRTAEGQSLPEIAEMLSWLDYIENVCPECEPPEWPLD